VTLGDAFREKSEGEFGRMLVEMREKVILKMFRK
jgi:hypothetical protein